MFFGLLLFPGLIDAIANATLNPQQFEYITEAGCKGGLWLMASTGQLRRFDTNSEISEVNKYKPTTDRLVGQELAGGALKIGLAYGLYALMSRVLFYVLLIRRLANQRRCIQKVEQPEQHDTPLLNHTNTELPLTVEDKDATPIEADEDKSPPLAVKDQRFLDKAIVIREKHYQDPHVSVDTLADEMNITARQLRRKIKALTGVSPNAWLQSYRLEKSLVLLTTLPELSEAAYQVGFDSYNYYGRCFRQKYDMTPRQYRTQAMENPEGLD